MKTFDDEIALECLNLERVLNFKTREYLGAHSLQGKSWYAIGLEDNSTIVEKDNRNKKNIIRHMVAAISAFIGNILKKIKDFFIVSEADQKQNDEFAKKYTGPTRDDLASAVNKEAAKSGAPLNTKGEKGTGDPLQDAMARASKVLNQRVDVNKAKEYFNGEKMALITHMLRGDRIAMVSAILDGEFKETVDSINKIVTALTSGKPGDSIDKEEEFIKEISLDVTHVNNIISKCNNLSDQEKRNNLSKWVMYKDPAAVQRAHEYFQGTDSIRLTTMHVKNYLESLQNNMRQFEQDVSDEGLAKVQHCQKVITLLPKVISIFVKIDSTYSTVIKGLRK